MSDSCLHCGRPIVQVGSQWLHENEMSGYCGYVDGVASDEHRGLA